MRKRFYFDKWMILLLTLLLILSSMPISSAMDEEEQDLIRQNNRGKNSATTKIEKIDPQLLLEFEEHPYTTYFIKFKEQLNVEYVAQQVEQQSLYKKMTPAQRKMAVRNTVIHSLQETAQRTQTSIVKQLDELKRSGKVKEYHSYYIVNTIAVTSTKEIMEQLAAHEEVESVLPNQIYYLDFQGEESHSEGFELDAKSSIESSIEHNFESNSNHEIPWNMRSINVKQVWDQGIDGTGIVVAIMDSGVDLHHPALERKWRGYDGDGNIVNPELSWYDATPERKNLPFDGNGHGTHVMGTMVGSEPDGRNQIGVAPNAKWVAVRVFDSDGEATDAGILDAAEWILAPRDGRGKLYPHMAPDVINNSWGSSVAGKNEFLREIVIAWRSAYIFPAFAVGNKSPSNPGGPGSVVPPANYPISFATGAVDHHLKLAPFSLRGPSPYGPIKPEVVAPGVNVRSSIPGGRYAALNGTSMASPHTAGVVALLLQANYSLTIDQLEEILKESAVPLTDNEFPESPNNGYGWGIINAFNAVSSLVNGLSSVEGQITIAGEDLEAPVIEHESIRLTYNAIDQEVYARVMDQTSVVQVELEIRPIGSENWEQLKMRRISGNHLDGIYEGIIPVELLVVEGIEYKIEATDFSGNQTTTQIFSVEVSEGVTRGYRQDFESDLAGFDFGGDKGIWEWGEPTSGPGSAYSGTKLIATKLAGNYPAGSSSFFVLPLIDLRDGEHTLLSFQHWYKFGSFYGIFLDRGEIYIGRESTQFQFERVKSYDFRSNGWKEDFVDLSPYAGDRIYIIFNLYGMNSSDEGWYIDDLALIDPDLLPPPAPSVSVRSNAPQRVIVEWEKGPEGNIMDYVVYRSTQSEGPYEEIGVSTGRNYGDTPTPQKGTYYYIVKARTYSHILSEPSNEVSWTYTGGEEIFSDDFEREDPGWTLTGENNQWERGRPNAGFYGPSHAVSGVNVWGTNLSGPYAKNSNQSLISPEIDLTHATHASIYFQQWYDIEEGDRGYVEISSDGGNTWVRLAQYPKSPYRFWWLEEIGIDEYVGQKVKIRFLLQTGSSLSAGGWYIDDFEVRDTPPVKSFSEVGLQTDEGVAEVEEIEVESTSAESEEVAILFLDEVKAYKQMRQLTDHQGNERQRDSSLGSSVLPVFATVTILETDRSTKTDPGTGRYMLKHPPGEYNLRVESYGYQTVNQPVRINSDQPTILNINLQPLSTGWITGTIIDHQSGEPIKDASVRVIEDIHFPTAYTDGDGNFFLEVYEGTYQIVVSALGYHSETMQVNVVGDQGSFKEIRLTSFSGEENELIYDRGIADDALAFNTSGNAFAVRMTTDGPAQVTGARFYFWDEEWPIPGGTEIQYAVYDASGPDGTPGKLLSGPYHAAAKRDGSWTDVELPTPVMVNGDFYVVYMQMGEYPYVPGLGIDTVGAQYQRSWKLSGQVWSPYEEANYMIRAKVITIEDLGSDQVHLSVRPSKEVVDQGEPFTVGIAFSSVNDFYSAQFSLTYDANLSKGSIEPSSELSIYQGRANPEQSLIVNEKVTPLDDGRIQSDYLITLVGEIDGFTGVGSLAVYHFSSDMSGEYYFELSNVRMLDGNGEDIEIGKITSGTIRVEEKQDPIETEYQITGKIVAEAFGTDVDYSLIWYEGVDGVHRVLVEAINAFGDVVKIGRLEADGTYQLRLPEGSHTIRVVVPSHFAADAVVNADRDQTIHFGPLTAGDVNGDGVIDLQDLQMVAKAFGKEAPWQEIKISGADLNRDGEIDMLDISFILNNFGHKK